MTEEHNVSTDDQDDGQGHVSDAHSTQPSSCGQASPVSSPVASHGDKDAFAGLVDEVLQAVQPSTSWAGQQNSAVSLVWSLVESPDLEQFGSPPLLQPVSPPPTHVHSPPLLQRVSPLPTHVHSPMHLHNPLTTSTDYIHNLTSQCVSKVLEDKRQAYWQMLLNLWSTEAGEAATASPTLRTIKDDDPDYVPEPESDSDEEEE